jgi:hypothetical protein
MGHDPAPKTFAAVVRSSLDDVLVPYGFAPGQGGTALGEAESQVIFCASFDDVVRRHLPLPAPDDYAVGTGHCLDIIVTGSLAAGVTSVDIEGVPLGNAVSGDLPKHLPIPSGHIDADLTVVREELVTLLSGASAVGLTSRR